jgi:tetratricopeptide (TPR) repeat protein
MDTYRSRPLDVLLLAATLLVASTPALRAQDASQGGGATDGQTTAQAATDTQAAAPAGKSRIDPIFPRENPNIVFVEGEDAASTNFNSQPTLNYSVSGKRTLQLSSTADLQGDLGYYADYVFYVPAAGEYEMWYGGTPAGPSDELYPSFFSPFRYRLDGGDPVPVYREDIVVNENYAPSYYWNRMKVLTLEAGVHRLRFEVRERRRYDNHYYFYLDCFFLVRMENGAHVAGEPLPAIFPRDLESAAINHPFRSIDDYLVIVGQATDRAQKIGRQVELATIYSMVGDYVNALRYLSRAAVLDPANPDVLLLQAKNQIWKGDVADGLASYRKLLEVTPERADLWVEAGKVAAWTSRYDESTSFLSKGLERFPGDLDLMVNLGLTYLWESKVSEAERMFQESVAAAGNDLDKLKYLATVYKINGYPERAIALYRAAIGKNPADLESYLLLENADRSLGKEADAAAVTKQIEDTFVTSPELERYLATYRVKQGLIDATIQEYQKALATNPDNLELRQVLAQTYYWNGRQREAIDEYLHILMNHAFRSFRDLEGTSSELLRLLDTSYLLARFAAGAPDAAKVARAELDAKKKARAAAAADLAKAEESLRKATGSSQGASEAQQAEVTKRQDALAEQERLAGEAVAAAAVVNARLEAAAAAYGAWTADLQKATTSETEEQRLFKDEIKASRWSWNRQEALAEAAAQANSGLAIAQYVVARIAEVERRFPAADVEYAKLGDAQPEYTYGRGQSALWAGKLDVPGYVALLRGLPEGAVPYMTGLADAARQLGLATPDAGAGDAGVVTGPAGADVAADLDAAAKRMDELLKQTDDMKRKLPAAQRAAHRLLSDRMVRAIYKLQYATARLRNELGDFYLNAGDRDRAIQQYRYVLAVDPSNIDAIYRLGTTSALAGDWSGALGYYERVWQTDPLYGNAAALHNRIAEEHADTVRATATYSADPSHVTYTAGATYDLPLASFIGIQAAYDVGSYRSSEQLENPAFGAGTVSHHLSYLAQTVSLTLPLRFYRAGFMLAPRAGAVLVHPSLYFTGDPGTELPGFPSADLFNPASGALGPLQFLSGHTAYPFVGLDYSFERSGAVRIAGSARWGTYAQTLGQPKTPRPAIEANLGISPVLSSLNAPVLRDVYLRSYGEIALLPTIGTSLTNAVGLVAQDVVVPFRFSSPVSPSLALEGSFYYADSLATSPVYDYYSPHSAVTAKGGVSGSLSFAFANGSTTSLSARVAGGYTRSYDLSSGTTIPYALLEANGSIVATRRGATVGVRSALAASLDAATGALGYRTLSVSVDVSARMPRLLVAR